MTSPDSPGAPAGVAAERTRLAWRRTSLAVLAGTLAAARMVAHLGWIAWAIAVAGCTAALVIAIAVGRHRVRGTATLPLAVAAAASLLGMSAIVLLVHLA